MQQSRANRRGQSLRIGRAVSGRGAKREPATFSGRGLQNCGQ